MKHKKKNYATGLERRRSNSHDLNPIVNLKSIVKFRLRSEDFNRKNRFIEAITRVGTLYKYPKIQEELGNLLVLRKILLFQYWSSEHDAGFINRMLGIRIRNCFCSFVWIICCSPLFLRCFLSRSISYHVCVRSVTLFIFFTNIFWFEYFHKLKHQD